MIKQLITDIAYDNIKLSQALTRSKLIANKIKNETFMSWLKNELEGYDFDSENLPDYRKVYSEMSLIAKYVGGQEQEVPFTIPENTDEKILDTIYNHRIIESIPIVEIQLENSEKPNCSIKLPTPIMEMLTNTVPRPTLVQIKMVGGVIDRCQRNINTIHYQNVIQQTKQKLLDILMQLEEEFPNLENDYIMNEENNKKADNIITNNIYGGNVPLNISTGDNVSQTNTINIESINFEKLRELQVEEKEIAELETIVNENKDNKSKLTSKLLGWFSSVSSSLAGRGLYENIPEINEFIQGIVQ